MRTNRIIPLAAAAMAGALLSAPAIAAPAGHAAKSGLKFKVDSKLHRVALRPAGVRAVLRDRGYYNINFTDRRLPVYKARACRNGKRFRLLINRWGKVMLRDRIGKCRRAGLSLPQIRQLLRNRGYYRINYTDRALPVYQARACRNGKRFHLLINRFGGVMDRNRVGRCRR